MPHPYDEAVARARAMTAPLDQRLAVIRAACRALAPDYDAAIDGFAARLAAGAVGALGPGEGEAMPDFALPDQNGAVRRLGDFLAQGPLVLLVLRGDWCAFCGVALAALAEAEPALRRAGAVAAALAPQRAAWGARQLAAAGAAFPMLADIDCAYAATLGLAAIIGDAYGAHLSGFGVDLAAVNGDEGRLLPAPALYVVDRDGRIALRRIDPDPRRRADPSLALGALARCAAPPPAAAP
jgi:peroxiredoxin